MRIKAIGATSFFLLAATPVNAQALQSTAGDKPSPLSEIAHNLTNWLGRISGQRADQHPVAASPPPLPRARPANAAPAPVVSNERPAEVAPATALPAKKIAPPVQIND